MQPFTLNIKGRLMAFDTPVVAGIVNATPDSFYGGSRAADAADAAARAAAMVAAGARIIDVGACSTRPGAAMVDADAETARLAEVLPAVRRAVGPDTLVSVDTFRADVARRAVEDFGADIVNDVAGGNLDPAMFETVAELGVPYILGHMRGTPADMQEYAVYDDVAAAVLAELGERLSALSMLGVADVIVDPGFGFAKTLDQNYELLARLPLLGLLHRPVMAGLSRKSMATVPLGITADQALDATTALNVMALDRGAALLRVHDVRPAVEAARLYSLTAACEAPRNN